MNDDFADKLGRAIRYSMDTVTNLLSQLGHPDHLHTRLGKDHPEADEGKADHHLRLVAADALQDNGRDEEAGLLRDGTQHVMVQGGKVVPARLTHEGIPPIETYLRPAKGHVGDEITLYRYRPSDQYMRGSHWGEGTPAWCITEEFDDYPNLLALKHNHPNAKPFDEAFPGQQFDEVQHTLTPEELNEEPDPDHPHNRRTK
jgi:hypothetical protein